MKEKEKTTARLSIIASIYTVILTFVAGATFGFNIMSLEFAVVLLAMAGGLLWGIVLGRYMDGKGNERGSKE